MQPTSEDHLAERKGDIFDLVKDVTAACNEFIKDQIETEAELEKESTGLAEEKNAL